MGRIRKALKRLFLGLLAVAALVVVIATLVLRASLPTLDGELELAGLSAPAQIQRDALGVATINAANQADAMRALGFVHAQERYFIMDLTRRDAAGELSALFGEVALDHDIRRRLHRFRDRARKVVQAASDEQQRVLRAYAEGINAGLAALGSRPPEYFALGFAPQPWLDEDSVLVVMAMYFDLQDERAVKDANLGLLHAALPADLAAFLSSPGTGFDAPIDGSVLQLPAIPASADAQAGPTGEDQHVPVDAVLHDPDDDQAGSNNWAVAGSRSQDGRAWLANDMHLGLRNPNIWYRARLKYRHGDRNIDVVGVSLPGTPGIIAGSNGSVAWGFTNSYGDYSDRIVLETNDQDPERYRGPDGWLRFKVYTEIIEYGHLTPRGTPVKESIWGPVVQGPDGSTHAIRWTAHETEATNLWLAEMAHVQDLDEAMDLANRIGSPAQNFVVADHTGRIGWTIMGRLPRRDYPAARLPVPWQQAGDGSTAWLTPAEYPRVVDPEDGVLWSANARVVGGEALAKIGDAGYATGARAMQIRDGLRARDRIGRQDHLDVHLDDRALFLTRWQELLLATLDAAPATDQRSELRQAVSHWGGRAAVESTGYLAVRRFRLVTMDMVIGALTAPVHQRYPDFDWNLLSQVEHPLWLLVSTQAAHLLPAGHADWQQLLLAAADRTRSELASEYGSFAAASWGARNQAKVRHPLSRGMPGFVAGYLDIPALAMPGDSHMPRVQGTGFGASQRMAVSPGDEQNGYFHMPAGQSGHFLSPFYGLGHQAWVDGEPTSFLPGASVHELTLMPPAP